MGKDNRRHTLGGEPQSYSSYLLNNTSGLKKGNVFNISQNFSKSVQTQDSNKYISKTTINLSTNPPITYSPNNSVTCDIKSPPTNVLHPRPWRQTVTAAESGNPPSVANQKSNQ